MVDGEKRREKMSAGKFNDAVHRAILFIFVFSLLTILLISIYIWTQYRLYAFQTAKRKFLRRQAKLGTVRPLVGAPPVGQSPASERRASTEERLEREETRWEGICANSVKIGNADSTDSKK